MTLHFDERCTRLDEIYARDYKYLWLVFRMYIDRVFPSVSARGPKDWHLVFRIAIIIASSLHHIGKQSMPLRHQVMKVFKMGLFQCRRVLHNIFKDSKPTNEYVPLCPCEAWQTHTSSFQRQSSYIQCMIILT